MIDPISLTLIVIGGVAGVGGAGFGIKQCIAKCFKKKSDTHETATVKIAHPDGTVVELQSISDTAHSSLSATAVLDVSGDDEEPRTVGQSPQSLPLSVGPSSGQQTPLQKLVSAANEMYSPRTPSLTPPPRDGAFEDADEHVQLRLSQGDRRISLLMSSCDPEKIQGILVAADGFLSKSHTPTPPLTPRHNVSPRTRVMQIDDDDEMHTAAQHKPGLMSIHHCQEHPLVFLDRSGDGMGDERAFPADDEVAHKPGLLLDELLPC